MEATVRAVGQALARVHDLPYLQTHPLGGRRSTLVASDWSVPATGTSSQAIR